MQNYAKPTKTYAKLRIKGKFILTLKDLNGNIIQRQEVDNLVTNVGKYVYARLLAGDTTYSGAINWLGVGTGLSTPSVTDTLLETEIARTQAQAPTPTRVNNEVTYEYFFSASEAIGTLREVGAFIDGTASLDTGQLFDRSQINIEKTSLNSLTIQLVVSVL